MKTRPLSGADAAAEGMRQINPDVVPAYPITPQTPIMHAYAQFVSDGIVDSELIRVESEHSAMSAAVGASAAGARVMTATSSQGLALMAEIVYIAASLRLPIVMNVTNRALSGPINIHCDHSDTMMCRDSSWIQIYSEDAQEVYENTLIAIRMAEHPDLRLPVMVCQDGFITSHEVMRVDIADDKDVAAFVSAHAPDHPLLDTDNPVTVGPLDLFDYYFEHKRQQSDALTHAIPVFESISEQLSKLTGRRLRIVEPYRLEDADIAIVCMNSSAGTARFVVDELRKNGVKAGLLKIRLFRPFPSLQIVAALRRLKAFAVLDRADSFSSQGGPLFNDVRSAFYEQQPKPKAINFIYGLGGRDFNLDHARSVFADLQVVCAQPTFEPIRYLGVRE